MSANVVKRGGERRSERYDHDKLYSSVYAACLCVRSPEGEAATIADRVATTVHEWVHARSAVTSNDIRRVAASALAVFHPEASYLYQTHQSVV